MKNTNLLHLLDNEVKLADNLNEIERQADEQYMQGLISPVEYEQILYKLELKSAILYKEKPTKDELKKIQNQQKIDSLLMRLAELESEHAILKRKSIYFFILKNSMYFLPLAFLALVTLSGWFKK